MAVALITGGSAGVGAALADRLASRGYDLLLVARDPERLHATARAVAERHGVRADVLAADLATRHGVFRVAALLSGPEAPAVDVLVNHAAGSPESGTATTWLTDAVLPGMLRRGTGAILTVDGAATGRAAAFTDALLPELAGTGVRALAVCHGPVDTGWNDDVRPSGAAGRVLWTDAERVADIVLADLDAGRTRSGPGPAHRPLIAALELPRRALRTVGAGARMARRGAQLFADVTRRPLMPGHPARPAAPAAGPAPAPQPAARRRRAVPGPGCGRDVVAHPEPAAGPATPRTPSRLPDSPARPGAGRAVAAAGDCGRTPHYLAGGPRTPEQRARAAAAARDRARSDRPVRGPVTPAEA